jgi:branched-chain amino acid transport system substrate-binding protein
VLSTLHYGDGIETKRNKEFRLNYAKTFKMQPDVYAVQGYDTGLLLVQGANAVTHAAAVQGEQGRSGQ